ncbi:MAG: metal ABC transporter permease [Gemmataceae bacterium]|nr:metal ABC transporter permease [Gemmata sp.]MDW8196372.1 metal ABC transporter permease [Gemmataceae bacterium]
MSSIIELTLVLALVAAACALPGVFLVLRRAAMTSDAIGHVLLFGIVVAYFLTRDLESPWLLVGAAAAGLLAVILVETLAQSQQMRSDAALGLVFSALFAAGVLLVSVSVKNVHLDVDSVLLGQPELATEPRWSISGVQLPPVVIIAGVLVLNGLLVILFFKELKLSTFDPELAAVLGFHPAAVHYGLMTMVAITAVASFDAVGPVLVVGFFVVPAAAAYVLTNRLAVMVLAAMLVGIVGAVGGTLMAEVGNTTTAGAVAATLGLLFAVVFVTAPERGLIAQWRQRRRQIQNFQELMLAVHLLQHEGLPEEADESRWRDLHTHLSWQPLQVAAVVRRAEQRGLVVRRGEYLHLTDQGRTLARSVLHGDPPSLSAG